jgi:hypothetical protein
VRRKVHLQDTKGVFGWVVTFEKAVVDCDFEKSSCEKHVVEKAEDCLVQQL